MKNMIRCVLGLAVLAGCSDPGFHGTPGVKIAHASEVTSCRMVENISMKPGTYGSILGGQGVKYARNKVLDAAAKDGANTVVFDDQTAASEIILVTAKAYSC